MQKSNPICIYLFTQQAKEGMATKASGGSFAEAQRFTITETASQRSTKAKTREDKTCTKTTQATDTS